jgi:hypothetical protein
LLRSDGLYQRMWVAERGKGAARMRRPVTKPASGGQTSLVVVHDRPDDKYVQRDEQDR